MTSATVAEMRIDPDLLAFADAAGGGRNQTFSEDCLKLNVWTKPQSGEKGKAVMMWIYGGGACVPNAQAIPH